MMTAMLALTLNAFLDPSGLVRDLRADGNLLANEVRFHIAAPQWNGTWGMTGDTRTSRVTGRKLSPSGMIVTGEFNGGPKLLWQVEMRRKGDGIVYACRVKSARGIVPAGAVLIRVLVPNRIAIGRRVMCIFPHLVEERKFPTALERNYVLWRHSGFLALLWEGEGNKFLCIRPLKGVRYFQLQDNRRFKGDTFEAQFYADSALRDDRWVEIAVEFEAMDEANAMAMVKTVREAERSIATALHSSDRLRIHSVSVVTKEPRAFRKLEIRIDLSGTWNNPFDPNQIDVVAEIAPPRGRAYRIPAFFYVPFER
ncbi:MAG TPA: hypothetical protein EYP10_03055, partial [Armatimonadetes bacterium]|nr:hypothetical protein [Armatimonadota bacterium]